MSVKLMSHVWELDLDHPRQSVMLALADHAHDDGSKCFPGVSYLAWKTGYHERQVQRILRLLETSGLLVPVSDKTGGRGHATEYQIDLAKGVKKSPFVPVDKAVDKSVNQASPGPTTETERVAYASILEQKRVASETERVASETLKGDTAMSPQPSVTISNHQKTESLRDSSERHQKTNGASEWPDEWLWLKNFIGEQKLVSLPDGFTDFAWWDRVSYACGGIDRGFLETEFAKMGRWLMDNPRRVPTPKGYRRFVAGWLERAHDRERRVRR